MLSIRMRKTILSLLLFVFFISAVSINTYADEKEILASEYIRSTTVKLTAAGSGELISENKLGAAGIVDKLGIKKLEIQKKVNGYWQSVYTISEQYQYNTGSFILDISYYGTLGAEYRSYVEFYVENDGESETKPVVSFPVIAQ